MKKILLLVLILLINTLLLINSIPLLSSKQIQLNNNQSYFIIDEFTWAFMKYDCNWESRNYKTIKMPTPDPGTIIIISDMISIETCNISIKIFNEDKMEILKALEKYDLENIKLPFYAEHPFLTILMSSLAAKTHLIPVFGIQKFSIKDMLLFHNFLNKGKIIGDCYSQAIFNTAVLRLCGFSPEEVFTILIPMHALNIVKLNDQWLIFDSVSALESGKAIYESYKLPIFMQKIYALENDKYFINFGRGKSDIKPYLDNLFSNIDPYKLIKIIDEISPILSYATLGDEELEINDFIEKAVPCPEIISVGIPYTVNDAEGLTNEEKAISLTNLNKEFVLNQTDDDNPNQYDRGLYSYGLLSVKYPQAYANAAKFGSWSSFYASYLDSTKSYSDVNKTGKLINLLIKNINKKNEDVILFSDFAFQIRKGSTIDKALLAYGLLRNMKKDNDYWQPEELYVLITDDYLGYLAFNNYNNWKYLNFDSSGLILDVPPENIYLSFNEIELLNTWDD